MAKVRLTSRHAENKKSMVSFEAILLFGLAVAIFAGIAVIGRQVFDNTSTGSAAYEDNLDAFERSF